MIPDKIKRSQDFIRGYQSGFGAGEKSAAKVKPRKIRELLHEIVNHTYLHCGNLDQRPAWLPKAEAILNQLNPS